MAYLMVKLIELTAYVFFVLFVAAFFLAVLMAWALFWVVMFLVGVIWVAIDENHKKPRLPKCPKPPLSQAAYSDRS